jgi:ribosomal protein S18 acetylase RimI-like enzyme
MLIDYQSQSDACKKRGLPKDIERYVYLFFIGTDEKARGKGLASQVIRREQAKAVKEGLSIWLEATTPKSREIYKKCGFEVVGDFVLGKGSHAASGEVEKNGPGVSVWAMFWRPAPNAD